MTGGSHRGETRTPMSRECVQAAAFGGDGSALDAVRGGEFYFDGFVAGGVSAVGVADFVDLRGAHSFPREGQVARDLRLHADVVRLVVARAVAGCEDARELVE